MTDLLQVCTTLPSREQANDLGRQLVEARLAACAQVLGPIESIYRWDGQVQQAQEWLLVVKSTVGVYDHLEEMIRSVHPYQLPEILAQPVMAGNPAYLDWIRANTARSD